MCGNIEASVGEDVFKSEMYLQMVEAEGYSSERGRMFHLHKHYLGHLICGEIKLAITLRLLAGGSYLDLAALYVCGFTYVYEIFHYVIGAWICNKEIFNIDFYKNLTDDDEMKKASTAFASGTSHGIMYGCIGALDGWLVKIKAPSGRDGVENVGGFFSRKGFYALNVQVIVDKWKRVIWYSINCRGGEHDSTAFKRTSLYNLLVEKSSELARKGWFIVADSAYSIRSFVMTPFDNVGHGSREDDYNYFHSSCRIW